MIIQSGKGKDGTTFTPSVSSSGVISWTNDGGKENPQARDLVQAVIDAIGTPVIGTVDANNQISLSRNGLVEEGTYTVKYVKEDGTEVDIGTLSFSSRDWTEVWYFYSTNNNIGDTYQTNSSFPSVMQYPNKVCKAIKGDTIVINADITKLTKVDILELYPLTVFTNTEFSGKIISKVEVQASQFIDGKYTYTATNDNCAGIGFRFKAISNEEGQALANSIIFEG